MWVYVIIFCKGLLCMLCMCFYVFRFMYVRLSRPACHHPTQNTFPSFPLLSYLFHHSSGVRSVCFLLFFSIPIVVDHLLYLFFYTLYIAFLFYGSYISIVFKNGSMVLQRTMYDPFLRAILIPKCTYFCPGYILIFDFSYIYYI